MLRLHSVVYSSTALVPFSTQELSTLLAASRVRNEQDGITGMLLYKDGCFMQAFEGEKERVLKLHARIARDPRHARIVTLLDGPIAQREFPDWTMGFKNLCDRAGQEHPAFSDILNLPLNDHRFTTDPSLARRLLLSFTTQSV